MTVKNKLALLLAAVLIICALTACVNTTPVIHEDITPEQGGRAAPNSPAEREDDGSIAPTPVPTDLPVDTLDELGNMISGAEHFQRYLTFRTILVYEEEGDTFLDGIINNDYVKPITCAVDVVYDDDSGSEITRARLQTRDGKYLLVLQPGENVVFARILTDMTLTEREYRMEFDKDAGVKPVG